MTVCSKETHIISPPSPSEDLIITIDQSLSLASSIALLKDHRADVRALRTATDYWWAKKSE